MARKCSKCGRSMQRQRRDVKAHIINYDVVLKSTETPGLYKPQEGEGVVKMWLLVCTNCREAVDPKNNPLVNGLFTKVVGDPETYMEKVRKLQAGEKVAA